jgi:hypothetical protein
MYFASKTWGTRPAEFNPSDVEIPKNENFSAWIKEGLNATIRVYFIFT